ncbi:ATP-binding protein [Myxococcota bacterium]|nr:ATP-binding protein [Myxococcota bacterium]
MLRLVELHVRKYRDLVDGGPLRFGPGPVFLLGPNGSGKTTLLELIGVLLQSDLRPLFREEQAVELSWVLEAEAEGVTTRLELTLEIEPLTHSGSDERAARRTKRKWRATGVLHARSAEEQPILFSHTVDEAPEFRLKSGERLHVDDPTKVGADHKFWLLELAMDLASVEDARGDEVIGADRIENVDDLMDPEFPVRFDEALSCFGQIVGDHNDTIEMEERDKKENWPNDIEQSHDIPDWVRLPNALDTQTTEHTDSSLLNRLLGAERVEFSPRLISVNSRGHRRWRGFDIYVHWDGGAIHHHSQLSFGQKRLIALIWRVGVGVNLPLLTDELTNGLHAGWVQAIIDHLGPRQGFHAVQNPLLLDRYGPGEGPEEIAGRFVICTVETAERGRQWRWRSPTTVECERLWQAYIAGFQHLSELLISEGLW